MNCCRWNENPYWNIHGTDYLATAIESFLLLSQPLDCAPAIVEVAGDNDPDEGAATIVHPAA